MPESQPVVELDAPFSSEGASPTSWAAARAQLEEAGVYWLSTMRPNGRPHVTPIAAVWLEGSLHFSTGPGERKARNLVGNASVVVTTGCNHFREGLDVVIDGDAVRVTDQSRLELLAAAFAQKYQGHFGFTVGDGHFLHENGGRADVYEVRALKAFAYGRGDGFSATRFVF